MSTAVLNHPVLPHRFLAPPPPPPLRSDTLSLLEAKRRFQPPLSPLISTSSNLPYRVATCLCSPSSSSSSPRTRFNPSTRLFVSGLSFRTSEDSLVNAFKKFGELVEVNLVMDKIANRPRGFAFLRYATEEESKKAIEGMHGKFLDGRVIFVEIAKSRAELRQGLKQNSG
ncbi:putative RNA-binding protein (RRM superfamily) [Handroanthus impetiginosus]|uniref:Putative RNA-binding protein (RRM superfamily) n=1 Tax=Handroanthus impetiginosus TaxID=429701 RepID=A0A2G9I503_9LAMI|nr:putative RNA-binding protein (RRM superfamily) [Handroanthus impetiginosus]